MPTSITPSGTFPTTVQTIANGDAASEANFALAPQKLTDGMFVNKGRLDDKDEYVYVEFGMSGAANGDKATLSISHQSGGASVTSDELELPSAGKWMVTTSIVGVASDSVVDNSIIQMSTQVGVDAYSMAGSRPGTSTSGSVCLSNTVIYDVTDVATKTISVRSQTTGGNLTLTVVDSGQLSAVRIS